MPISALESNTFVIAIATGIGILIWGINWYRLRQHQGHTLTARLRQQAYVAELGQMALVGTDLDQIFNTAVSFVAEGLGTG